MGEGEGMGEGMGEEYGCHKGEDLSLPWEPDYSPTSKEWLTEGLRRAEIEVRAMRYHMERDELEPFCMHALNQEEGFKALFKWVLDNFLDNEGAGRVLVAKAERLTGVPHQAVELPFGIAVVKVPIEAPDDASGLEELGGGGG